MEVLGNSSELKESEVQNPEVNYSYRFPRDITLGVNPNAKGKGETDVNFLVACKVQLSSEVIRWKTETLRLQKERDSAQMQYKELDRVVAKLRDRMRELEDRLMQAEEDNRQMKSTSINMEKERACLVQKLNYNANKCSSLESSLKFEGSHLQGLEQRKLQFSPQEDWREVSQKMLQQMKNEMKELQEMSSHYQTSERESVLSTSGAGNLDCKEVKVELSNLLSETQSIKQHFSQQRQKLESIIQILVSDSFPNQDDVFINKSSDTDLLYSDAQNVSTFNSKRMSAEDYRLHFSKQLENTSDAKKMARKVQHFLKNPDLCVHQKDTTEDLQSPELSHYPPDVAEEALEVKTGDSEKVCPICQISFGASVSQADFEEHVVNHLEKESASLLDQYVIV